MFRRAPLVFWLYWFWLMTQICTGDDDLTILQATDSEGKWTLVGARVAINGEVQITNKVNSSLTQLSILTCNENIINKRISDSGLIPCFSRSPGSYLSFSTKFWPSAFDDSFIQEIISNSLGHLPELIEANDPLYMNGEGLKLFRATELQLTSPHEPQNDLKFLLFVPGRVLSPLRRDTLGGTPAALCWSAAAAEWLRLTAEGLDAVDVGVRARGEAEDRGLSACWRRSASDIRVDLDACSGARRRPARAAPSLLSPSPRTDAGQP